MGTLTILIFFVITNFILEVKSNDYVKRVKRIVGGDDASREKFPHQVCLRKKIGNKYTQFCGGSIIDKQFILTAAHCVIGKRKEDIQVVLGITDLNSLADDDPNFTRKVLDTYPHGDYNKPDDYANDIALVKIEPITFDDINIAPIELPEWQEPVLTGTKVWISGWGRTYGPDSPNSPTLKATTVTVIDHDLCVETYTRFKRSMYPTQFCAHGTDKNDEVRKGGCNNDSGGPVTLVTNGKRTLIGIMSWAKKDPDCASPKFPDVFTKVSEFVNWTYKQMDRHRKPKKEK